MTSRTRITFVLACPVLDFITIVFYILRIQTRQLCSTFGYAEFRWRQMEIRKASTDLGKAVPGKIKGNLVHGVNFHIERDKITGSTNLGKRLPQTHPVLCLWSLVLGILLQLSTPACASAPPLLQAAWLPVTYNCSTPSSVQATLTNLANHGVQRVYVDVWNQGTVYFNSSTMASLLGQGSAAQGRDLLRWTLEAAAGLDMEVIAWFEYGLTCSYQDLSNVFAAAVNKKGWVLGLHNSFYWMDPANPEVEAFLNGIIHDAIVGYSELGLKGVQLDDHFGTPVELGRTQASMNALMLSIHNNVQAAGSFFSLSPNTLNVSNDTYNVDWNSWGSNKWYDEVIPQLYCLDYNTFASVFDDTWTSISSVTRSLFIASGVRIDGTGAPTPYDDVNKMIQLSKSFDVGTSIWYSHGILEIYPTEFGIVW